jgi:GNAT superfamily N-acetyltransferase
MTCLQESRALAGKHRYEPQTDYHKKPFLPSTRKPVSNFGADRKGTMIHPDFQRRGFGTFLTHHYNAIADKTGGKTWVSVRPTSLKTFRQCGFKDVATHNADLKRWGGNTEEEITWLLVREAQN